jgi:hypothetical protein
MIKEVNKLIAERVPPGDQWTLIYDTKAIVYSSIAETLEAHYHLAETKPKAFRLEPAKGLLFAIVDENVEETIEPIKTFNIYGE